MSRNIWVALLVASLFTMSFRCGKDVYLPPVYDFEFELPVDIFPLKKVYSLRDTIWLKVDVQGKMLFDTKSKQFILADTGRIDFQAIYSPFGTAITNPANGFAELTAPPAVSISKTNAHWATSAGADNYGCGRPDYAISIGFIPNYRGNYYLMLPINQTLEDCPGKSIPYHASIYYKYKNVDLNKDILHSIPLRDRGGKQGSRFYEDKINKREIFVFTVQ